MHLVYLSILIASDKSDCVAARMLVLDSSDWVSTRSDWVTPGLASKFVILELAKAKSVFNPDIVVLAWAKSNSVDDNASVYSSILIGHLINQIVY